VTQDRLTELQLTELQELLTEGFEAYRADRKTRRVSDADFARFIGISPASWSQYITGDRKPGYRNTIIMSRSQYIGERIFEVLGYEKPLALASKGMGRDLLTVVDLWPYLDAETQREIVDHVREVTGGGHPDKHHGKDTKKPNDKDHE